MRWDEAPSSGDSRGAPGAPDPAITQLSARQRFDGAIEEAGAGLADILWRVVCAGAGISHAEKALRWPARAGKLVLNIALDRVRSGARSVGKEWVSPVRLLWGPCQSKKKK